MILKTADIKSVSEKVKVQPISPCDILYSLPRENKQLTIVYWISFQEISMYLSICVFNPFSI